MEAGCLNLHTCVAILWDQMTHILKVNAVFQPQCLKSALFGERLPNLILMLMNVMNYVLEKKIAQFLCVGIQPLLT